MDTTTLLIIVVVIFARRWLVWPRTLVLVEI